MSLIQSRAATWDVRISYLKWNTGLMAMKFHFRESNCSANYRILWFVKADSQTNRPKPFPCVRAGSVCFYLIWQQSQITDSWGNPRSMFGEQWVSRIPLERENVVQRIVMEGCKLVHRCCGRENRIRSPLSQFWLRFFQIPCFSISSIYATFAIRQFSECSTMPSLVFQWALEGKWSF